MAQLVYGDKEYQLNAGETVLECLLRHSIEYPHSCQAGVCQSCLIKSTGQIETAWQEGIQETLKAQGYFLACLAKPCHDLKLLPPLANECEVNAQILSLNKLNHNVLQVRLSVENLMPWTPGQYLNWVHPQGIIRSYSIANLPMQDGFIELHIKLLNQGAMSQWLQKEAKINDLIKIRGPLGKCFYFNPQKLNYDILLAGTGTGLAPLLAIVRDALSQQHRGEINLIHACLTNQDLYCVNELKNLAAFYPQFHYHRCVLKSDSGPSESIEHYILGYMSHPKNLKVFICGPSEITHQLKMKAFCAGVPSSQIFSDAFL
ncbi:MAG: FAD-binding oxidoreductase [Gammaproteobacteria bacterium]|nr:FAD-binding oxidoreductase [Gammaproteobacteria bacterium]